ncbi:NADPH-dependent oxidoreductase [Lactobacillus sp. XV13L]|nr:NADPH-dependent oxidoreductase [Lactobacillus sp. XV13L]
MMKYLFINASANPRGVTASLAARLMKGESYQTFNLADHHIYPLGQENTADDQFDELCKQVQEADALVIGTPVYWSSMSAYMKIMIDRMTGVMGENNPFSGKNLYLIVDGSAPQDAIPHIKHVWEHVSRRFNMNFKRTVTNG